SPRTASGSPGASRIRRKASTVASATVTRPCSSRPATQRVTSAGGAVPREGARRVHVPAAKVAPRRVGPERRLAVPGGDGEHRGGGVEEDGRGVGLDPGEHLA